MKTAMAMILIIAILGGCSASKTQIKSKQYEDLFSDKGEWVPVNSQKGETR